MKKHQKESAKIIKEIKNIEDKLINKISHKDKKVGSYIVTLGAIDYHINLINDEIKKTIEFDPWDEDIYMYKKIYLNIREEIIKKIEDKTNSEEIPVDLSQENILEKIENFSIEKLRQKEILNFCINYKKGYKSGAKMNIEEINKIYKDKKAPKQRIKK